MTAPSEDIRVASQGGTRPPCKGRIALPERFAIESKSSLDLQGIRSASQGQVRCMVRNVIEYRGDSTAGMLCSHICREAPDII